MIFCFVITFACNVHMLWSLVAPHNAPDVGCRLVSLRILLKGIAGHRDRRCASCLPASHVLVRLLFHWLNMLRFSLLLLLLNALLLLPGGETLKPCLFLLLLLAQLPAP